MGCATLPAYGFFFCPCHWQYPSMYFLPELLLGRARTYRPVSPRFSLCPGLWWFQQCCLLSGPFPGCPVLRPFHVSLLFPSLPTAFLSPCSSISDLTLASSLLAFEGPSCQGRPCFSDITSSQGTGNALPQVRSCGAAQAAMPGLNPPPPKIPGV